MILDDSLFSIEDERFIIEDIDGDNGDDHLPKKLTKRFKSKAKDHVRIFKWDFGDNSPILETDNRTVYHTYTHPGTYLVRHQACSYSWCCSNWCLRYVKISKEDEEDDREEENMSHQSSYSPTISITSPEFIISSIEIPEFFVEDILTNQIQSLNGGYRKRFTSSASLLAIVFKWDFGDNSPIQVTHDRSIEHEYHNTGPYIVRHQACFLDAPCCYSNDIPWCTQTISVLPSRPASPAWLAFLGIGGFLLLGAKRECEEYNNKKDCEEVRLYFQDGKYYCKLEKEKDKTKIHREPCCEWIDTPKEKRCVPRCKKDYERKTIKGKTACVKTMKSVDNRPKLKL